MEITHNVVGWFEIPVTNMERAMAFYERVFDLKLTHQQMGPLEMAFFPWVDKGMGSAGSLVFAPVHYQPSAQGPLIYFTAFSGDLANELSRVEAAGGKALMPKTLINEEIGYMAMFLDTEGNRVALHSRK
jgi:predicted enzyme related to lactoylglutathione lyase